LTSPAAIHVFEYSCHFTPRKASLQPTPSLGPGSRTLFRKRCRRVFPAKSLPPLRDQSPPTALIVSEGRLFFRSDISPFPHTLSCFGVLEFYVLDKPTRRSNCLEAAFVFSIIALCLQTRAHPVSATLMSFRVLDLT